MYICILDYRSGKVVISKVDDSIDAEDYVSEEFGLDNVEFMVTDKLNLEISEKND